MVEVITRQTDDIRRIDEFSKFARMPELKRKDEDLGSLVSSIISLQQLDNLQFPSILRNLKLQL